MSKFEIALVVIAAAGVVGGELERSANSTVALVGRVLAGLGAFDWRKAFGKSGATP